MELAKVLGTLKQEFGEGFLSVEGAGHDTVVRVKLPWIHGMLTALKRSGFHMLVDLTAVDRSKLPDNTPRFELTYRLMALDTERGLVKARLAVKTRVAEGEAVPRSAMDLWPIADWLEREVWDMFGVPFADRPGIKRLLMYEEFQGHPLRKDFPIARRQPLIGPKSGERPDSPSFNQPVKTPTAD